MIVVTELCTLEMAACACHSAGSGSPLLCSKQMCDKSILLQLYVTLFSAVVVLLCIFSHGTRQKSHRVQVPLWCKCRKISYIVQNQQVAFANN